ncbi:MAG: chaperone modulator CbpM [Gammaproteobacteria bacterium]|uniref:chaperone modulator CbpM n=1 Tax=Rhodoferax sp. TaxID=50421 RepID=UPI00184FB46C|nr:chaperone modulator CbpM [Rhodoferax sp.]MBU3897355.1 chaperone modulator CbpM [Gammaproteobacteria bacterium]MBA3058827.1 MerR family transcriptional regulator [Rhodoferax sp.]MBU3999234.1 chaperone modulator CbpM [Gammaproteobacteria bacterium]MBU4018701.1 chaperone modulator CbpM [Gammaproteobacteria bacterium]MBU4079656.1 chaperone modulator CbpM [Gammaproteobacteria bacterium]
MSTTPTRGGLEAATEPVTELTLLEVSRCCAVQTGFVIEMIEEGALSPMGGSAPESWRFSMVQTHQVMVAARLQRDLGVNLPGAALALQLLDEVETLRAQITAAAVATATPAAPDADRA